MCSTLVEHDIWKGLVESLVGSGKRRKLELGGNWDESKWSHWTRVYLNLIGFLRAAPEDFVALPCSSCFVTQLCLLFLLNFTKLTCWYASLVAQLPYQLILSQVSQVFLDLHHLPANVSPVRASCQVYQMEYLVVEIRVHSVLFFPHGFCWGENVINFYNLV